MASRNGRAAMVVVDAAASPVDALEALRNNFCQQLLQNISGSDMAEVARAMAEKGKAGDTKAAKVALDFAAAINRAQSSRASSVNRSVNTVNVNMDDMTSLRIAIASILRKVKHATVAELIERLQVYGPLHIKQAINWTWFCIVKGQVTLTDVGIEDIDRLDMQRVILSTHSVPDNTTKDPEVPPGSSSGASGKL